MSARSMSSKLSVVVGLIAWFGLAAAGCAGSQQAGAVPDNGQNPGPGSCTEPQLYLVSAQDVTVQAGGSVELKVRLACASDPYAGALVGFEIVGDPKASALSSASSQTDDDGVAGVALVAGATSATFQVKATTEGAGAVTFDITVNSANAGTILVSMTYAGPIVYNEYKAYLFQGRECATLDPFAITGAIQDAAVVAVLSATPKFNNVPAGSHYAVAVTARRQGELLGFGCKGSLSVTAGQTTNADVAIFDIPITYSGVYTLDNHFDMTGLLPPTVDGIVHVFDELSDDHAVEGNLALDQWGEDPAAFMLDFVYREFCKWECTNTDPSWDDCTPGVHPSGDLKETYRGRQGKTPFMSWEGDQPRYMFLCGMLDPTWGMTQWVQSQVQAQVPPQALNILDTVGDIARAIDKMHVKSRLSLNDVRYDRLGNFTHTLETMYVDLHDLGGTLHNFEVDLAAAGVGTLSYSGNTSVLNDELQIPSHSFSLKFGKLVQYIYASYLLPLLGCNAPNNTTACLFQKLVNCTSVGTWLHDACDSVAESLTGGLLHCPISATQFAGFCSTGLQMAGNYVDASMASWIGGDTQFTLQGEAAADRLDGHRVAASLKNGVWTGHWTDGAANATFPGTFTGVRQ
ncbi:MAG: hypothetical protein HY906_14285 [Deltaproteobacteria bacterium]|nr:hypothetical protein [Deltaproteobacteria bacterium]